MSINEYSRHSYLRSHDSDGNDDRNHSILRSHDDGDNRSPDCSRCSNLINHDNINYIIIL